jgi:hypothetical protein
MERLRYPGSGLRVRDYEYRHFVYQFLLMSAILPVISTRFPAVNRGLHVNDKRVRVFSVYYFWAV